MSELMKKCDFCAKLFQTDNSFYMHMREAHNYLPMNFFTSSTPPMASSMSMIKPTLVYLGDAEHKDIFGGGDPEPELPEGSKIMTVEPIFGGMEGDKVIGHKTTYHETWDADLYNYGSKGMQSSEPFWRSKNGEVKKLVDIGMPHLKNIINMLMKRDASYKTRLIFKQLLEEQKRREDTGELW